MRVVYTLRASADLDAILSQLILQNPLAALLLAERVDRSVQRAAMFPESAPLVAFGDNIRALTLARYPYRIFYRVRPQVIEILHIRHAARAPWEGGR
jgi:plasmid stabilization system protein ParE